MKKVFVLSKGLEKFSKQQIKNMELITGGVANVPVGKIHYPTSGGGRRCSPGLVWSEALQRCVATAAPVGLSEK